MKKALKLTLSIIIIVVAALFAILFCVWGGEIKTLLSVERVAGNEYLYKMEYKAGYDLDDVIGKDIDSNAKLMDYIIGKVGKGLPIGLHSSQVDGDQVGGCTSLQAKKADGEGYWYGRNYDFYKNPTMVTYSRPEKGYASIAVSDMSHFGYGLDNVPTSLASKLMCLASIYAPVDGINEKGLCTSIMAIPHQASQQESGRHKVGTSILMRVFLDRCATVTEAIEFVSSVDVRHDAKVGSGYHYMVADASGDCVIFEFDKFDGWKTVVLRKGDGQIPAVDSCGNSMLITNHLLGPKYRTEEPDASVGNPSSKSWDRYTRASAFLAANNGILTLEQMQECLASVRWVDLPIDGDPRPEDTQYSNVYDQTNLTLSLRNWNRYDTTYFFALQK